MKSTVKQENAIEVKDIHKSFTVGGQDVKVLNGIKLSIPKGSFIIIFGPSGCGKSTLLHIMLGLEPPTSGSIKILDNEFNSKTDPNSTSRFRKESIGIIYQQSLWIRSLSVRENVALPLTLLGEGINTSLNNSISALKLVDMLGWADYMPSELSSGQQQRIALARSIINDPEIIFADEPTGNLDYASGQKMMQLFFDLNQNENKTIVMVTHDLEYLPYANIAVRMFDGKIVGEYKGDDKEKLISDLHKKSE